MMLGSSNILLLYSNVGLLLFQLSVANENLEKVLENFESGKNIVLTVFVFFKVQIIYYSTICPGKGKIYDK